MENWVNQWGWRRKARRKEQYPTQIWGCAQSCPGTVARQAPLSMELSRQEYCSALPFPTPGDLPNPGIKPTLLVIPALTGGLFTSAPLGLQSYTFLSNLWVFPLVMFPETVSWNLVLETQWTSKKGKRLYSWFPILWSTHHWHDLLYEKILSNLEFKLLQD